MLDPSALQKLKEMGFCGEFHCIWRDGLLVDATFIAKKSKAEKRQTTMLDFDDEGQSA